MSKATQPASLSNDNFSLDFLCTVERKTNYTYTVPQYVIDRGNSTAYVTVVKNPPTITMTVFESTTPVTWNSYLSDTETKQNRVQNFKEKLLEMYLSDELFTLTTPDDSYENMAITAITFPEDDYLNAMEISISLKQVIQTTIQVEEVSYEYSGDSDESTGTIETTDTSSSASSSSSSSSSDDSSSVLGEIASDFWNWWSNLINGNDFSIGIGIN